MANKIQLRRDTTANWNNVNPILADGEPGLDITTNQVKYGDGANAWVDLSYASGGGFTNVEGLVTFPGDLLIGTLWPEDPLPMGDKESVIWAKDDTEYLGLWWGGDQTYPDEGYGPVAGIMIGSNDEGNLTDDFSMGSPAGTKISLAVNGDMETKEWIFDRDGNLTFPQGTLLGYSDPGGFIIDGAVDKDVAIYTYSGSDAHGWTFGADGNLTLPEGGTITSSGNLGNVVIQSSSGSPRNFVFNTDGSITLPSLYAQGNASIDSSNNQVQMNASDTVDFASFSGMVLVNCYNSGTVSMYLCGGGSGGAPAIGNSKVTGTGVMAWNEGIDGYTFTATETGIHAFTSIKTRNGA